MAHWNGYSLNMNQHNIYIQAVVDPHIKQLSFLNDDEQCNIMIAQLANCLNVEQDEDVPDGECKLVV